MLGELAARIFFLLFVNLVARGDDVPMYSTESQLIIACVGDSITRGTGEEEGYLPYPTVLENLLGKGSFYVRNFGKGGSHIVPGERDYRVLHADTYERALNSNADVFILQWGTNDAFPSLWNETQYRISYGEVITTISNLPQQPVVVLGVPPPYVYEDDKLGPPSEHPVNFDVHRVVPEIAEKYNLFYANNFELFGGFDNWNRDWFDIPDDGVHPNGAGYEAIAQNFYRTLVQDVWPKYFGFALTYVPTYIPTASPSHLPTLTPQPTNPTPLPSTSEPSSSPSRSPTYNPTPIPIPLPTPSPTQSPTTPSPTHSPSTISPTRSPSTYAPTYFPTPRPTPSPTPEPSISPTRRPTPSPTPTPSFRPTHRPTEEPTTSSPSTWKPTPLGSAAPTVIMPTLTPTPKPSPSPSLRPSVRPSSKPTIRPTPEPSSEPTLRPTTLLVEPTRRPTIQPAQTNTGSESHSPSIISMYPTTESPMSSTDDVEEQFEPSRCPTVDATLAYAISDGRMLLDEIQEDLFGTLERTAFEDSITFTLGLMNHDSESAVAVQDVQEASAASALEVSFTVYSRQTSDDVSEILSTAIQNGALKREFQSRGRNTALFTASPLEVTVTSSSSPTSSPEPESQSSNKSSKSSSSSNAAAIYLGIIVAAIILLAISIVLCCICRRRQLQQEETAGFSKVGKDDADYPDAVELTQREPQETPPKIEINPESIEAETNDSNAVAHTSVETYPVYQPSPPRMIILHRDKEIADTNAQVDSNEPPSYLNDLLSSPSSPFDTSRFTSTVSSVVAAISPTQSPTESNGVSPSDMPSDAPSLYPPHADSPNGKATKSLETEINPSIPVVLLTGLPEEEKEKNTSPISLHVESGDEAGA